MVEAGATLKLARGVQCDVAGAGGAGGEDELLGGFDYGDHAALDEWVGAVRARLSQQRLDEQAGKAARLESQGALAAAIELCERIVARAPWHEHSWRRLMRLHYLRGDRAAAINTFERLEHTMRNEQGSRPSAETIALLCSIKQLDDRPAPAHGPLPASLVRPPLMIGRDTALQAMAHAWESARAVLVLGEGGIGKSRLMDEFLRGRHDVLEQRARPGDAAMPYSTMASLLRQALERFAPELNAALRSELTRLLPSLGEVPQGEGQQAVLWQAVETVLARCGAHGLAAVVVDDLHLADAASVELLRWLVASRSLVALRFCFAARPDEPGAATPLLKDWVGDSTRVEAVHLAPLVLADVQALLDSLQLRLPLTARALYQHAGGHPFYTLETLKALVSADAPPRLTQPGLTQPSLTQAVPSDSRLDALPKPSAASAMIERRLQRLSDGARELLRVVALAGGELPLEVTSQVMRRPLIELAPAWAELEAAQVMQGRGFAHELVRECALALVPGAMRPALHGQLALALAAQADTEPTRLAQHWFAAEQWPAAADCYRRAARSARIAGRLAEHEALLRSAAMALLHAGDAAGRFDALCEALTAHMMRLGSQAALDQLDELLTLATTDAQRSRTASLRSEALLNLARFADALSASAEAVALVPVGCSAHTDAVSLHGRALALTGQALKAVNLLDGASRAAAASGNASRELHAVGALAHALQVAGQPGAAVRAQQRAVALSHQLGDVAEIAQNTANLATLASMTGQSELAWECARDADARLTAMGAGGDQAIYNRLIFARCAAHRGELGSALQLLRSLQSLHSDTAEQPDTTIATMSRVALCALLLWLGQNEQALATLPAAASHVHPLAQAGVLLAQARALHLLGRDAGAAKRELALLAAAHPSLRDDPALAMGWCLLVDPGAAVTLLQRLRGIALANGADGMARSMALCEVQQLLDLDAPAAARLARQLRPQMSLGLHISSYPPQAWWTLACALRKSAPRAAQACAQEARRWIESAVLPEPAEAYRQDFLQGNPVNRALRVHAADGAAPRPPP